METRIKEEVSQRPVFVDIPDATAEASPQGQNHTSSTIPIVGANSTCTEEKDANSQQWMASDQTLGRGEDLRRSASSSSSGATHISAGATLNALNSTLATPDATVQENSDQPSNVSNHAPNNHKPSSAGRTPRQTTMTPSHTRTPPSRPPSSAAHTSNSTPNYFASSTSRQDLQASKPGLRRGVDDPLPTHLRALLQEYYDKENSVDLPPCALVSDNKQSIYIFPGGKKARYVNRQGEEVTMRREQLPESGYWVSVIEGPTQAAVFVKRLPKYGPTPGFGGTSIFIWNGIEGFEQHPSFFKVPIDEVLDPSAAGPPPSKKVKLSEPVASGVSDRSTPTFSNRGPSMPTNSMRARHFLDSSVITRSAEPPVPQADPGHVPMTDQSQPPSQSQSQPQPQPQPQPQQHPGYPGSQPGQPGHGNVMMDDQKTTPNWQQSRPQPYPNIMYATPPQNNAISSPIPPPANTPSHTQIEQAPITASPAQPVTHTLPPIKNHMGHSDHQGTLTNTFSSQHTNPIVRPTQPMQQVTSVPTMSSHDSNILSADQKSRTSLSFVGGVRARTRPFTLCDTIDKLFVHAAAAGLKNFSVSAATFLMIRVRQSGMARNDPSVQEIAVVKDDELDFQQLQEIIRETGNWDTAGGVECEVTTID